MNKFKVGQKVLWVSDAHECVLDATVTRLRGNVPSLDYELDGTAYSMEYQKHGVCATVEEAIVLVDEIVLGWQKELDRLASRLEA